MRLERIIIIVRVCISSARQRIMLMLLVDARAKGIEVYRLHRIATRCMHIICGHNDERYHIVLEWVEVLCTNYAFRIATLALQFSQCCILCSNCHVVAAARAAL